MIVLPPVATARLIRAYQEREQSEQRLQGLVEMALLSLDCDPAHYAISLPEGTITPRVPSTGQEGGNSDAPD